MKCVDYTYFYHDLTPPLGRPYGSPRCHFNGPEGWAPREQEECACEEDEEC